MTRFGEGTFQGFNVSRNDVAVMATLGLRWHEIHGHFPAYDNYHPEGLQSWRSGHSRNDETPITQDMIRRTIENLHAAGAAAMPYIQVAGDGDDSCFLSISKDRAFETCLATRYAHGRAHTS